MKLPKSAIALVCAASILPANALAATATGSLAVRVTIQAECKVASAADLDFGTRGVIDANVDQSTTISIQCTNTTPYTVGLSAGGGAGATISARKMTGPAAATIDYSLYTDAARTTTWSNVPGPGVHSGTGNGAAQSLTVYGRIPPQTTPAAGAYSDAVTITVSY